MLKKRRNEMEQYKLLAGSDPKQKEILSF